MKEMILTVLLFLISPLNIWAQPLQKSLSGNIVIDPASSFEQREISIQDFKYIGSNARFYESTSILDLPKTKPAVALFSSAIIPGSGQAINRKRGRAAAYFLIDVASILYYIDRNNTAKRNERAYEEYANSNWSVLAYGQWLVEYSRSNGIENGYNNPGGLEEQVFGKTPTWGNTPNDWDADLLTVIRAVEVQTPFFYLDRVASVFSHVVQDYGSQQYYELMSKYYQFQPGWRDFHETRLMEGINHNYRYPWDASMLTLNFIEGRDRADEFNNNYRQAGNILKLIMVNHIVSAFDAYFTVKLKNSRIDTQANLLRAEALSVTWYF